MAKRKQTTPPARYKLGYDKLEECAAIEQQLIRMGYTPGSFALHFAVLREYDIRHKNDPSYKERCAKWQQQKA